MNGGILFKDFRLNVLASPEKFLIVFEFMFSRAKSLVQLVHWFCFC